MCRLTWSSSSLAVLTRGPRTQRLQPNHVIFVSKSSRRINYTQETAEPLGVSPPEAVDLLLIKSPTSRTRQRNAGRPALRRDLAPTPTPALALSPLPDLTLHLSLSLMCEPLVNPSIEGGRHTSTDYDTTAARVRAFVDQGGGCRATFFNYRRYLM